MRHVLGLILFGTLFSLGTPFWASACDCIYPNRPCSALAHASAVFSGRVIKISTISIKAPSGEYQARLVAFEIERGYRGLEGKAVVEVVDAGGDCAYGFRVGEKYLVYAGVERTTGKLHTGNCSRTRRLAEAAEDLEYFAKKDDPAHGAGIEGLIDEESRGKDNGLEVLGPLKGARVRISGAAGQVWTVTTSQDGRFQLWGLPPGTYRVTPEFAPKFAEDSRTVTLQLKSCEDIRFLATPPPHRKTG